MSQCGGREPYALMVLGDSMLPEFKEGDIITIEPDGPIESEAYVIAMADGEYIFRQLIIAEDRYFLKPLNDLYPVKEIEDLSQVHGRITQKKFSPRRADIKHYL